jgi:hypothetical protein
LRPRRISLIRQPDPISFSLPDGTKGRAWPASKQNRDDSYSRIIGDDRHCRLNVLDLFKRRPTSAKVRAIVRINHDATYHVAIDYDGNHEVIERSEMLEDDVGAILAAWNYRGTFALRSESLAVVTYATNDGTIPIPEVEKPKPDPIKGFRVCICIEAEKEL